MGSFFKSVIPRVNDDIVLEPVTIKEVKKIIKSMKNSNSRGNTEITNQIVKTLIDYLGVALSHLANTIYKTGVYPKALKIARVLPLKKSGKPSESLNSFRPINNLCPLDKIIEETLRTRIDAHLKKHKVIPNNTHGRQKQKHIQTDI